MQGPHHTHPHTPTDQDPPAPVTSDPPALEVEATGDQDVEGTFYVSVRQEYLYIEAVGSFNRADMRRATQKAAEVIREPGRRWNIVTDFTNAYLAERNVQEILSDYSRGNKPFVRKSAVLGLSGIKRFFFDLVVRLSGRSDLRPFKRLEEAEAWLRLPLPADQAS